MEDFQITDEMKKSFGIEHPEIIDILKTIKMIQHRMKDPDIRDLEYIEVYDKLGKEFNDFFDKHTGIFVKVISGDNVDVLASVLFYRDKVLRNLIPEHELSDKLANKYLPANLKAESDIKLKELMEKGKL